MEAAKGINTRRLIVIDVGTFEEGEVDDEVIDQMKARKLERRLAELNVSEEDCDVIFLVRTIVSPPDYGDRPYLEHRLESSALGRALKNIS